MPGKPADILRGGIDRCRIARRDIAGGIAIKYPGAGRTGCGLGINANQATNILVAGATKGDITRRIRVGDKT